MTHHDPEEPHGVSVPMPHHHVNYFAVFATLVVLTIASIKASCVCLFFMHLKFEGKLIYLIMIIPLILTVILVCALIPDILFGHPFNSVAAAASAAAGH